MSRSRTDTPALPRRPVRSGSGRDVHEPPLRIRLPDLSRAAAPFGRDAEPPAPAEVVPAAEAIETPAPLAAASRRVWWTRLATMADAGRRRATALNWKWYAGTACLLLGLTTYSVFGDAFRPAVQTRQANREPVSAAPVTVSAPPMPLITGAPPFPNTPGYGAGVGNDVSPPGPPPLASDLGATTSPTDFNASPGFAPSPYGAAPVESVGPLGPNGAIAPSEPRQPGVARLAGFIIDQESPPVEARHEPYRQSFH
ncbi:MAG TPA: hypothetical protein VGE52_08410 [Pirellulales bacterium]